MVKDLVEFATNEELPDERSQGHFVFDWISFQSAARRLLKLMPMMPSPIGTLTCASEGRYGRELLDAR